MCFIESEDELPHPLLPGVVISLPSPNNIPDIHHSPLPPCASPPLLHRSSRIHGVAADPVALQLDCADPSAHDPLSFGEARRSVDWPLWEHALEEELASIHAMNVYNLVPRDSVPAGRKVLQGKPVFRIKHDEHGTPMHFKAHWVLKGYEQVEGLDYVDTHAHQQHTLNHSALAYILPQ